MNLPPARLPVNHIARDPGSLVSTGRAAPAIGCSTRGEDAQRPMADYLFVPQSVLDRWSEQGRIEVDGNVLTILGEHKSFALTPAVRFIKMEAGDDNAGLLAKVKTTDALKQMGAEHYMESVILGESAYQVQQGFLADANALRRAAAASQAAAAAKAAPAGAPKPAGNAAPAPQAAAKSQEEKNAGEQDMLAQ